MRILLLNPPGTKSFFRDYYCAKVSKANYYYHPIDLVYLSGRLSEIGDIKVIDAIAEKTYPEKCHKQIVDFCPDVIISLSSAPSYKEDMIFLSSVSRVLPDCRIIVSGDIFRDYKIRSLVENPFLDAILLDFTTNHIVQYIENITSQIIPNIIHRFGDQIIEGCEEHGIGEWQIPIPIWEAFNLAAYHFPFSRRKPFASILTDFGCPYNCDFCPVSSLGFRLRPIQDVLSELKSLKELGVKELYIRDQTFGVNKKRSLELLNAILDAKLDFTWSALSRTDVLDDELLALMKKSGCHTLMIGIESANQDILTEHNKKIKIIEARDSIIRIKKSGIKVGGFFMLGFPGESKESIKETSKLACDLPLDYASFNVVSPRFGTSFRKNAIAKGYINPDNLEAESSISMPIWKNQKFSNEDLIKLRQKAVKKFYLRPSYLIRRLFSICSLYELVNLIREGTSLLRKS